MKRVIISLCFFLIAQIVIAQIVNFSGTWKINKDKSSFGEVPLFVVPVELSVKQTTDSLFLSVINVDNKGNSSSASAKYSLNGMPAERPYEENTKLVGLFKFSDDKKQLVKDQKVIASASKETVRTIKQVWTLSKDGKSLSIEQTVSFPKEEGYTVKAVYDKR
jgi:hypothetical protein